jgi:hypothetical protein
MKRFIFKIAIVASVAVFMNSCTIEKKIYPKGYSITWNHKNKQDKNVENVQELAIVEKTMENSNNTDMVVTPLNNEIENIDIDNSTALTSTSIEQAQENNSEPTVIDNQKTGTKTSTKAGTKTSTKAGQITAKTESRKNKVISQIIQKQSAKTFSSRSIGSDEIIGIILCLFGLAPFGVLIAKGKGSEFKTNLLLWLGGFVCIILGVVITVITLSWFGVIFSALGGILLLSSFIHGLFSILR